MLEETGVFDGLGLPMDIGGVKLELLPLNTVISVAPFKGQVMAVADVLRPLIGMILPPVGQLGESGGVRAQWHRPGQWLVFGEAGLMRETSRALSGMAAVADMCDAFGRLSLTGAAATSVLSRLCALDLEAMPVGQVAQSSLADISTTVLAIDGGFELLIARSYAGSVVQRLDVAMRSVAALSINR